MKFISTMKPKGLLGLVIACMCMHALLVSGAAAVGITADAGLTPPEGRWIFRAQIRYMQRVNDPTSLERKMNLYGFPLVLAYGVRSNLTLMVRQALMHREMTSVASDSKDTGLGDLFILEKYKAYRINTPDYTFGIAPTIGLEFNSGKDPFTSGTSDLRLGLYTSWRSGPWGSDFNIIYSWNGFASDTEDNVNPGDEMSLDLAFAHQFSVSEKATRSLSPVLELSYRKRWPDRKEEMDLSNSGESVMYVSPGIKFTTSSIILEALVQIPVWQQQEDSQLERSVGVLGGVRFLF